ncbi:MAG: LLM class flavin-dependent oxidoreductase [Candidatus Nitrosothermus koennekii]|nr:MAG: LLM class flavin-dependent oxidoreductase [Candidatus Nitrosothermus koennekii]
MEFGLILPQGWLNSIRSMEEIEKIAKHAEELNFNSLYAYDHLLPYEKYSSIEDPILECWTLLSSLIGITDRIKLGQVVLCNSYRNPALVAKMGATFSYLSNNRLEFGIGAGWYEEEYYRFGYQFPSTKDRLEQLEESLQIIKGLWEHGRLKFDGKHYKIDAICNPKPDKIKIMVGGSSKRLIKIASKYADRYNHPFGTPEEVREKVRLLREYNKDVEVSILLRAIIGSKEEIDAIANRLKDDDESVKDYLKRVKDYTLIGNNSIELLNRYRDAGVTHFIIHLFGLEDNIDSMDRLKDIISRL